MAWSPDGKLLATGPGVLLWQPPARAPWAQIPRESPVVALVWSRDGQTLATLERRLRTLAHDVWVDETLTLWGVGTRTPRFALTRPYISAFAWSPDGRTLATGGPQGGTVLLDTVTGKPRVTLSDTKRAAVAIAWRPDGRWIATAYPDGSVSLWSSADGKREAVLPGAPGALSWLTGVWGLRPVPRLAWSPDGKTLAVTQDNQTVLLWDTATERRRAALVGHTGEIRALAWSPDGKTLATGSGDGSLRLWRAATGGLRAALYAIGPRREWVTVTPRGYFLASKLGAAYVQGRQGTRLLPAPALRKRFMRADAVPTALVE